jgi:hypothetical protein
MIIEWVLVLNLYTTHGQSATYVKVRDESVCAKILSSLQSNGNACINTETGQVIRDDKW